MLVNIRDLRQEIGLVDLFRLVVRGFVFQKSGNKVEEIVRG